MLAATPAISWDMRGHALLHLCHLWRSCLLKVCVMLVARDHLREMFKQHLGVLSHHIKAALRLSNVARSPALTMPLIQCKYILQMQLDEGAYHIVIKNMHRIRINMLIGSDIL